MLIPTYNIDGVTGRLPQLLDWLSHAKPDVVCLQELKAELAKAFFGAEYFWCADGKKVRCST